mgnify:CR=1 FL=1
MIDKSAVLAVLSRHIGEASGVHIERLVAEILGTSERDPAAERRVRTMVSALREEGVAVCAHPKVGYFIAETEEEVRLYYTEWMMSRAMHTLRIISRVTKIAVPDLVGQLKLKT